MAITSDYTYEEIPSAETYQLQSQFLQLPSELLEKIVRHTATGINPFIASLNILPLSCTCKLMNAIIINDKPIQKVIELGKKLLDNAKG